MRRQLLLTIVAIAALGLASACDTDGGESAPLDPAETTTSVNESVQLALTNAAESMEFLDDSDFVDALFDDLALGDDSVACASPMPPDGFEDEWVDPCEGAMDQGGDAVDLELKEGAQEAADWLKDNVFTDANIESEGAEIVYLIPPSILCDGGGEPPVAVGSDGGAPMPPPDDEWNEEDWDEDGWEDEGWEDEEGSDEDCEQLFTDVPIRVAVSAGAGGAHVVKVLVGNDKVNPLTLSLHPEKISLELDIKEARAAIEDIADALGEDAPELPETLEGKLAVALEKNADLDYTISASVTQAVHVAGSFDGATYELTVAKADPAVSVRANGNDKELTVAVDWNAVDVTVPAKWLEGGQESQDCGAIAMPPPPEGSEEWTPEQWDEYYQNMEYPDDPCGDMGNEEDQEELTGNVSAHLGGASVSITLSEAMETLTFENLGLGDTTTAILRNGQQIIGVDFNKDHGRRLDAVLSDVDDMLQIQVDPALTVHVALDFANADGLVGDEAPAWTMDEDLAVTLAGAAKPTVGLHEDGLMVVDGTLTFSSTSTSDLVVNSGQCVEGDDSDGFAEGNMGAPEDWDEDWDEEEEEEHPFESLSIGICE